MARRRRVILTCEMCGQTFEETAVHAESRRFCSIACKAEYQRTALAGKGNPFYGQQHTKDSRRQISASHFRWYGEDNPNWHGGITNLKDLIRKSKRYKQWRDAVYQRDGYRSVLSGKRGQAWELVAHHKKPFIEILNEMLALYPELTPDKDAAQLCEIAMSYAPLWDIDNGVTLLRQEHIRLHSIDTSPNNDD
jgi:NUMOD3 motif